MSNLRCQSVFQVGGAKYGAGYGAWRSGERFGERYNAKLLDYGDYSKSRGWMREEALRAHPETPRGSVCRPDEGRLVRQKGREDSGNPEAQ